MILASLLALACVQDDVTDNGVSDTSDTAADTDTDTDGTSASLVGGTWVSEGENISALLQYFDYVRIEASFSSELTYTVEATDADGQVTTFTGAYSTDTRAQPATVVLQQSQPSAAVSEGIWQVDGDTLTYEVVQTTPSTGCTAPTPDAGFGSTSCGQPIPAGSNVQIFVR